MGCHLGVGPDSASGADCLGNIGGADTAGIIAVIKIVGKCLDLETVSKIKVNGAAAMQDCDGWIVRRPGLVLTIQ